MATADCSNIQIYLEQLRDFSFFPLNMMKRAEKAAKKTTDSLIIENTQQIAHYNSYKRIPHMQISIVFRHTVMIY